eukprot:5187556-Amphidinium_carterae.1
MTAPSCCMAGRERRKGISVSTCEKCNAKSGASRSLGTHLTMKHARSALTVSPTPNRKRSSSGK